MAVINRIGDLATEMATWRQHLHTIPELGLDCPKTAAFIAERLREIGKDARLDIEALLQKRAMLRLWVKVRPNWTDDERSLAHLGYDD